MDKMKKVRDQLSYYGDLCAEFFTPVYDKG